MSETPSHESSVSFSEALSLISRLYWALDAGNADMVVDCFEADATWHRPDGPKTGAAALRAIVTGRPAGRKTTHVPSNLALIEADGRVTGHYYLSVYGEAEGVAPHLNCCFDCQDEFVATSQGVRIREKRTQIRMQFA